MPGFGDAWRIAGSVVLVEARLGICRAAVARREARPVLTGEPSRRGQGAGELARIDVTATRNAVNVLLCLRRRSCRTLAKLLFAFALREALLGLRHLSHNARV